MHVNECLEQTGARVSWVSITHLGKGNRPRVRLGLHTKDKVAFIRFISYLQRNICRVFLRYMYMNV